MFWRFDGISSNAFPSSTSWGFPIHVMEIQWNFIKSIPFINCMRIPNSCHWDSVEFHQKHSLHQLHEDSQFMSWRFNGFSSKASHSSTAWLFPILVIEIHWNFIKSIRFFHRMTMSRSCHGVNRNINTHQYSTALLKQTPSTIDYTNRIVNTNCAHSD